MEQVFSAGGTNRSVWWGLGIALVIDLPIIGLMFYCGGASNPVSQFMILTLLFLTAFLVYLSVAARDMKYILGNDELRASVGVWSYRLPYGKIKEAERVDARLGFRVFGGSWPGAHWGLFTTGDLGRVQVYATRSRGEFVMVEAVDGGRLLLSPVDPVAFIEVLSGKTGLGVASRHELGVVDEVDRRRLCLQVAVVALAWLLLAGYVISIYPGLPDIIPVHFGFDGTPNRWGSKAELFLMVGVALIFPVLNTVFTVSYSRYSKVLSVFLSLVFLLNVALWGGDH